MVWWYIILLLIFVILIGSIYEVGVRGKDGNILEDTQVKGLSSMRTRTGRCKCFSCE